MGTAPVAGLSASLIWKRAVFPFSVWVASQMWVSPPFFRTAPSSWSWNGTVPGGLAAVTFVWGAHPGSKAIPTNPHPNATPFR
jgi:hypothetical protein